MSTKLCEIAKILPGHPFRGSIKSVENGEVHVVQVRNAEPTGEIIQDKMIQANLPGKKQPNWLQTGDVLFVAKGARHFSALVEKLPEKTVCTPHFFLLRIKPEYQERILPGFVCWQLNQLPAQHYFKKTAEGSLHVSIRRNVLENTPITLLPINKQRQLVTLHRCMVKEKKILLQLIDNRESQLKAIGLSELNQVLNNKE